MDEPNLEEIVQRNRAPQSVPAAARALAEYERQGAHPTAATEGIAAPGGPETPAAALLHLAYTLNHVVALDQGSTPVQTALTLARDPADLLRPRKSTAEVMQWAAAMVTATLRDSQEDRERLDKGMPGRGNAVQGLTRIAAVAVAVLAGLRGTDPADEAAEPTLRAARHAYEQGEE